MKKNKNKKVLSYFITIIIILVTLEFSPYLFSPILLKKSFSRHEIKKELLEENTGTNELERDAHLIPDNTGYLSDHILHPYLGFVGIPAEGYNEFCFPGESPIVKHSKDTINICLMGGSVAKQLYRFSMELLINDLKKSSIFKGKEFRIIVFALGGFKQPQQLIALNYFMSLGAEYDIVINLDGFNEVVLPYNDNLPFGIYPSYPRHWNLFAGKHFSQKTLLLLAKQAETKNKKIRQKIGFSKSPWKHSNLCLLFWKVMDNKRKSELNEIDQQLREARKQTQKDYQTTGPPYQFTDTTNFFKQQAELWKQASIQINQLASSAGFEYFHFLQPNQYVAGSKKLTKEELEIAYIHGPFTYKTAVIKAFPLLILKGRTLKKEGVNFNDLTKMFKNYTGTLYSDKCCHFNQRGYNMIADTIAKVIIANYSEQGKDL